MNEQKAEYLENLFQKFCNSYEDCPKESDCTECRNKFVKSIQIGIDESRKENEELKVQIEKMKSFIHSEIDFCIYCPLTNECKNEEGTCPYAYATEEEKNLLMDFIQKWELTE